MRSELTHSVAPYLLLAELGASLFGSAAASAEERITLEVIGAVRRAGSDTDRRANDPERPVEARPFRAVDAERADAVLWSERH